VDIFHPLEIKVLDHIIVGSGNYSSLAERGNIPDHCKDKANYEPIALGTIPIAEKRNRFQNTR
jgi:DNA repair protein RadC